MRKLATTAIVWGVPVAAMFFTPLPSLIEEAIDGQFARWLPVKSRPERPAAELSAREAPAWPSPLAAESRNAARPERDSAELPQRFPQPRSHGENWQAGDGLAPVPKPVFRPSDWSRKNAPWRDPGVVPVAYDEPPDASSPTLKPLQVITWPNSAPMGGAGSLPAPVDSNHGANDSASQPTGDARPPSGEGTELSTRFARLRQLGATYYLLETWGADEGMFRFHCRVSRPGMGDERHFEATALSPLAAVDQVMVQVERLR